MKDRELDALVAEKVFGRAIVQRKHGPMIRIPEDEEGWVVETEIPHFFTSIADAWLVVEEMRRRGKIMSMHAVPNSKDWCVAFGPNGEILDPSAPRCIALAALRALGVEVMA